MLAVGYTANTRAARTTVHFQTILDYFSPHDSTFNASTPDDVSENALSSNCTLHTANSISSRSGSTKKKPLDEIHEGIEEPQSPKPDVSSILARIREDKQLTNGSAAKSIKSKHDTNGNESDRDSIDDLLDPPREQKGRSMDLKEALALDNETLSDSDDSAIHALSPGRTPRDVTAEDMRPKTTESITSATRGWKPKIKLFTRTIDDAQADEARERAKLPSGMHIRRAEEEATRLQEERLKTANSWKSPKKLKSSKQKRSRSEKQNNDSEINVVSPAPAVAEYDPFKPAAWEVALRPDTVSNATSAQARPAKRKSMNAARKSTALSSHPPQALFDDEPTVPPIPVENSASSAPITPERQRLLKAMDLRKKQQRDVSTTSGEAVERSQQAPGNTDAPKNDARVASQPGDRRAAARALLQSPNLDADAEDDTLPQTHSDHTTNVAGLSTGIDSTHNGLTDSASHSKTNPENVKADGANGTEQKEYFAHPVTSLNAASKKGKRRTLTKPIDTSGKAEPSDDSSDGSYMDDLQEATVHEAVHVSIPNTPMSPTVSDNHIRAETPVQRKGSVDSARSALYKFVSRGRSNEENNLEPLMPGRALAPAALVNVRKPSVAGSMTSMNTAAANQKKTNVSSGISRRIQALEERSQRSNSPVSVNGRSPSTLDMPQTFLNSPHAENMSLASRPSSRATSRIGLPRTFFRSRMDSINDITMRSRQNPPPPSTAKSFTARIVRSPERRERRTSPEKSSKKPLASQQSQGTHDNSEESNGPFSKRTEPPPAVVAPVIPLRPSSRGSSMSQVTKSSVDFGLKFMGRKKSENRSPTRTDKSSPVGSLDTVQEDKNDTKKASKTSKFFKRVSGLSTKSRKSQSEEGGRALNSVEGRGIATAQSTPRMSSYIVGDLNVQFPDTLVGLAGLDFLIWTLTF